MKVLSSTSMIIRTPRRGSQDSKRSTGPRAYLYRHVAIYRSSMHPQKIRPGQLRPGLVRYVVLTARVSHPPHAMPHSGGALPSLSTKPVPSPLLACDSGLANAGPTAIIRAGRLVNDCRLIESFIGKFFEVHCSNLRAPPRRGGQTSRRLSAMGVTPLNVATNRARKRSKVLR